MVKPNTLESVLARVDRSADCWLWTGSATTKDGYGRLNYRGRLWLAHRLVYELMVGPVASDRDVHHTCGRPRCVNPAHLQVMTTQEHMARLTPQSPTYVNAHKTHCKRGHDLGAANVLLRQRKAGTEHVCRLCHNERVRAYRQRQRML